MFQVGLKCYSHWNKLVISSLDRLEIYVENMGFGLALMYKISLKFYFYCFNCFIKLQIRSGVRHADARWLEDNVIRKVGDGRSILFWEDLWLDEVLLARSFGRLLELEENKSVTVEEMYVLGWEVDGEAWKWRRRLFAWEEGLVGECADRLSSIDLLDGVVDRWVWKLTKGCGIKRSRWR